VSYLQTLPMREECRQSTYGKNYNTWVCSNRHQLLQDFLFLLNARTVRLYRIFRNSSFENASTNGAVIFPSCIAIPHVEMNPLPHHVTCVNRTCMALRCGRTWGTIQWVKDLSLSPIVRNLIIHHEADDAL
jgi:hypothetical protein